MLTDFSFAAILHHQCMLVRRAAMSHLLGQCSAGNISVRGCRVLDRTCTAVMVDIFHSSTISVLLPTTFKQY